MFWIIVLALLVVVLAAMFVYDRRHTIRRGGIAPISSDDAVGRAKSEVYNRRIKGMGPGEGP